jgi:hypothetical protein
VPARRVKHQLGRCDLVVSARPDVDRHRNVFQTEAPGLDLGDELRRHRLGTLTDGLAKRLDEGRPAVGVLQEPLIAGVRSLGHLFRMLRKAADPLGGVGGAVALGGVAALRQDLKDRSLVVVDQLLTQLRVLIE